MKLFLTAKQTFLLNAKRLKKIISMIKFFSVKQYWFTGGATKDFMTLHTKTIALVKPCTLESRS